MKNAGKITVLALLAALAMVLSYLESLLPGVGIPGVKLGLANIAVMIALYRLGFWESAAVSLVRVVTVSVLFGSIPALIYSLAGAVLSLSVMAAMKKSGAFNAPGVSVAGGAAHNMGQILAAMAILNTRSVIWYLPVLLLSGTVSGVLIGLTAALLIHRLEKL